MKIDETLANKKCFYFAGAFINDRSGEGGGGPKDTLQYYQSESIFL